jgi:DNA-binding response OmpR family regulator
VTGALRLLLESAGYQVSTAGSIRGALGISRTAPPALTFLDLTLPDGDGLALVEPLHVAGCKNVVALTGHDDDETRERCLTAGCTAVLVKPVPTRELLAKAKAWLD